jgi:hypothetical protein
LALAFAHFGSVPLIIFIFKINKRSCHGGNNAALSFGGRSNRSDIKAGTFDMSIRQADGITPPASSLEHTESAGTDKVKGGLNALGSREDKLADHRAYPVDFVYRKGRERVSAAQRNKLIKAGITNLCRRYFL